MARMRSPGLEHDLIRNNPVARLDRAVVFFGMRDPGFIRGVVVIAVVDDAKGDLPIAQDGSKFLQRDLPSLLPLNVGLRECERLTGYGAKRIGPAAVVLDLTIAGRGADRLGIAGAYLRENGPDSRKIFLRLSCDVGEIRLACLDAGEDVPVKRGRDHRV